MRAFLLRLRLAWQLLRARRFVVFLPKYPVMSLSVGGPIGPAAWEAICAFSIEEHRQALALAEASLLAAVEAEAGEAEAARRAAIEADIHALLKSK